MRQCRYCETWIEFVKDYRTGKKYPINVCSGTRHLCMKGARCWVR